MGDKVNCLAGAIERLGLKCTDASDGSFEGRERSWPFPHLVFEQNILTNPALAKLVRMLGLWNVKHRGMQEWAFLPVMYDRKEVFILLAPRVQVAQRVVRDDEDDELLETLQQEAEKLAAFIQEFVAVAQGQAAA